MRFLACLCFEAAAIAAVHGDLPVVEVQTQVVSAPMNLAFYPAQEIVAKIFSEIGLKIQWRMPPSIRDCSRDPLISRIAVAFSWNTPDGFHPGALAISDPYATRGACVTIFMDRLKPMLAGSPAKTRFLLGHVLAHEIGHILQGICRHSEEGVLKAHWSQTEIRSMRAEPLSFTSHDTMLIFAGIRRISALEGTRPLNPY